MTSSGPQKDGWNSRLGVILAVAGSAVGIGNFLRFPGQAATYGGGAFMIAYIIAFLFIGLPICWSEWAMGRYGGKAGFNTAPGIFNIFSKSRFPKYFGTVALVIPIIIYMYYVYIESWCLGYSLNYLMGNMSFETVDQAGAFFANFTGIAKDGSALDFSLNRVGFYLIIVFVINFYLIYRGLSKGIELFCKWAMPTLIIIAFIILIRVLTLGTPDPSKPENNVGNGLGFMWNPTKTFLQHSIVDETSGETRWETVEELVGPRKLKEGKLRVTSDKSLRIEEHGVWSQLKNPQLWLAAAGQIFFSLSVGFGIILTYASYLNKDSDVVLSGLTATSTNEFCEVGLGGLITLPAAVAFLGVAGLAGVGTGTFSLGFNVLPMVFSEMVGGTFFGFLFFFLLFLAAVTSSLSMLQPGIAFLEEALTLNRPQSVAILGVITSMGTMFVVYFSESLKALDTLDFWVGTFLIFILATFQIILFGWVWGVKNGMDEAAKGAEIQIPKFFGFVMKWVTPVFLLAVFVLFIAYNVLGIGGGHLSGYITDLFSDSPNKVAWMSVSLIVLMGLFFILMISGVEKYKNYRSTAREESK